MDCKKALVECDGDMDKAIDYLREKGQKLAAKRADRDASEGAVLAAVNQDKTFAAVIMMNCETDFVAKNEDFVAFSRSILEAAVASKANRACTDGRSRFYNMECFALRSGAFKRRCVGRENA